MPKTIDKMIKPAMVISSLIGAVAFGALIDYYFGIKRDTDANKHSQTHTIQSYVCPHEMIKHDDGDSLYCGSKYIRILGIDTPEVAHPEHGIEQDQEYGKEAVDLTNKLLDRAERVTIIEDKKDKYDRMLSHVLVDGELLAVKLIKAGLGYETISFYGDNGFPEFAKQIKDAAETSPKPKFEEPHLWRKKYQKK